MNLYKFPILEFLNTWKNTFVFSNSRQDQNFKGVPRLYHEAKELMVIDVRIIKLVDTLNHGELIRTIGSCEGHGWPFIRCSPYVSFKCDVTIAAALAESLHLETISKASRLKHFWEISACFDPEFDLTYSILVPGIMSGKPFYATRNGIDHDLAIIDSIFRKKIFNHLKRQNIKFECQENADSKDDQNEYHGVIKFIAGTLLTKRIRRVTSIALFSSCAQWFSTVDAFIQSHVYSKYIKLIRKLILSCIYKILKICSNKVKAKYIRDKFRTDNVFEQR